MAARARWTIIDFALLGVAGAIASVIFYAAWYVWDLFSALGPLARPLSVGLWFTGSIIAATLIKKPGAAFLGELLGAIIEAILPTRGGFTNVIYGFFQGAFAELGYRLFGYKRWDVVAGAVAGAIAGLGELIATLVVYREFFFVGEEAGLVSPGAIIAYWIAANTVSGALYGAIAAAAARSARP